MQPEVMIWFTAVIFAVIKVIQLAFIWDNREEEEE